MEKATKVLLGLLQTDTIKLNVIVTLRFYPLLPNATLHLFLRSANSCWGLYLASETSEIKFPDECHNNYYYHICTASLFFPKGGGGGGGLLLVFLSLKLSFISCNTVSCRDDKYYSLVSRVWTQ